MPDVDRPSPMLLAFCDRLEAYLIAHNEPPYRMVDEAEFHQHIKLLVADFVAREAAHYPQFEHLADFIQGKLSDPLVEKKSE